MYCLSTGTARRWRQPSSAAWAAARAALPLRKTIWYSSPTEAAPKDHLRRPGSRAQRGCRGAHQRVLEPVEEHCPPGPGVRPAGKILFRYSQDQLGVGHHHDPGRKDPALYGKDLPPGPPERPCSHRRHCQLQGFRLADELDCQPAGPVKEQDPDRVCVWVYGLFTDTLR